MTLLEIESKTNYLHIEGDIPTSLPEGVFISLERKPPLKIYTIGFQPAKSIPEIPRWFLQKYATSPDFSILEPFAGSGTTLIEALQHNVSTYWLDYQPFSRLLCQVKTERYNPVEVLQEALQVIRQATAYATIPLQIINFANKDFWFQKSVQEGLEILRACILKARVAVQAPLWVAFATTLRKTSDMNDGMILAARRSNVTAIPQRSREDVFKYFRLYVDKIVEALVEWNEVLRNKSATFAELSSHDARNLPNARYYDAVLTSPPYVNAIDYVWASKFELHWLGMVHSDEERLKLYAQEIGTERIAKEEFKELGQTGHAYLDQLIADIYTGKNYKATSGQNMLRARVVYKYFLDMQRHFAASFAQLKSGGYYCFAIGDVSRICGVDIPVASLLSELACGVGFRPNFHFHLLLKNRRLNVPRNVDWASTIKHDSIIVLEKP
jgi:hypothetical protein